MIKRVKNKYKRIKRRYEERLHSWMFEFLLENRMADVLRATRAMAPDFNRVKRGKWRLRDKLKMRENINALTREQVAEIKKTWGDVWDLNLINPEWVQIYSDITGAFNPEFVGEDLHFYYIVNSKNDFEYLRGFTDKNYQDVIVPCIKHPRVLIRKIKGRYYDAEFCPIKADEALDRILANKDAGLVVKKTFYTDSGQGVMFISENSTIESIKQILSNENDLNVQHEVKQHPAMAKMNDSSVNTLRIMTTVLNGKVMHLSTCVRIGNPGSRIDNFSSGGIACGVRPDGSLTEYGYNAEGDKKTCHANGFVYKEGRVPNYDKALEAVIRCHDRISVFGFVSWDIAIDESGEPMLIEFNAMHSGIRIHQYNNGPLYGEHREEIVKEAFRNFSINAATLDYDYSLRSDGAYITRGGKGMKWLEIPAEIGGRPVVAIDAEAFKGCKKLKKLAIPASVKSIGEAAFNDCKELVINCQKGSAAHEYAKNNKLKYKLV